MVVALLPSETLEIACFFDEHASQKRPRDDESDVGFGAFPSFDVVDDDARKAFSAQLPLWNKKTARRDHSEAMVFRDDKGGAVFFQDARRRYEFFCGEKGLLLLSGLLARTALVLKKNEEELRKLGPKAAAIVEEGRRIYGEKPSLRKFGSEAEGKNVTWSGWRVRPRRVADAVSQIEIAVCSVRSRRLDGARWARPRFEPGASSRRRRRAEREHRWQRRGATH